MGLLDRFKKKEEEPEPDRRRGMLPHGVEKASLGALVDAEEDEDMWDFGELEEVRDDDEDIVLNRGQPIGMSQDTADRSDRLWNNSEDAAYDEDEDEEIGLNADETEEAEEPEPIVNDTIQKMRFSEEIGRQERERMGFLTKEPEKERYVEDEETGVVKVMQESDVRKSDKEVFIVKKKLGKFSEMIVGVFEYLPSEDDITDNYIDTLGGGRYKVFIGESLTRMRKVIVYDVVGTSKPMEYQEAREVESKALQKFEEISKEMTRREAQGHNSGYGMPAYGGGIGLPHTPEEMAYTFLNSEKERNAAQVQALEKEVKSLERQLRDKEDFYKAEIDRLRDDLHKKDIELIKLTSGGSIKEEIAKIKEVNEVLGITKTNPNVWLDVLNSDSGQQLIGEFDKLTGLLEKKWETHEWKKRIALLKEARELKNGKQPSAPVQENIVGGIMKKGNGEKVVKNKDIRMKLIEKLDSLMTQHNSDVPPDILELAVDISLERSEPKTAKVILRNAVLVIQKIEEINDALMAIDTMILTGKKTPEEAAAFLIQYKPEDAKRLANYTEDTMKEYLEPYRSNPHISELADYAEMEEVQNAIQQIVAELRKKMGLPPLVPKKKKQETPPLEESEEDDDISLFDEAEPDEDSIFAEEE